MSGTVLQCDVLVVGGGPAGVMAAIAAARRGHRVLLVERYGAAGGAMTLGMNLTPCGFEAFHLWTTPTDPASWLVQGLPRQLHDRMARLDAIRKPVWDPETCKWQLDEMLAEAGVRLLYHAVCVEALRDGDRVTGAVLATRAGLWRVQCRVAIDASGDGVLLAAAGAAFDVGRESDGKPQPSCLGVMLGGLDLGLDPGASYGQWMAQTKARVAPHLEAAWQSGRIPPVFAGIWFPRVVRGGVLPDQAWSRLVPQWLDPNDPHAASQAETQARQILHQVVDFLRAEVPGFQRAVVLQTSLAVWPRESRRLRGVTRLEVEDVRENRRSDQGIAHGTGFLEAHAATPGDPRPEQGVAWNSAESLIDRDVDYDIPYGCLVPERIDGLLAAGRCLSSSHLAQSSARMQITCMAMGEAAGTAAALGIERSWQPREVPVDLLRTELVRAGARV